MGLGVGAGLVLGHVLEAPRAAAQESPNRAAGVTTRSGTGWINDAHRASGNGPIDESTRTVVDFVQSFGEAQLTDSLAEAVSYTMIDSLAALIAGFESESARVCARIARTTRSDLTSTVLGYGIATTPEIAAFANGCMLRHADFNDVPHNSDIISGVLAIGEALHSSGTEVMTAIALAYELASGLGSAGHNQEGGWDGPYNGPAIAMAMGKLLKLNPDQLANALSLSLVPHMPMKVTHVGALSMWKGCHSAESVRCAVFACMLAREGMTGPAQPFAGRQGLFDHMGPFQNLRLPVAGPGGKYVIERAGYKRFPSEGSTQSVLELTPSIHAWTKPEEIASIYIELPFDGWQETLDPPKWDPRNRETADHSMPYVVARALIDGEIYLDSFTEEKFMDPAARALMEKITAGPDYDFSWQGEARLTVVKKSGEKLVRETRVRFATPLTRQEIIDKFNRVCGFRSVSTEQRDRAREQWLNLRNIRDIAEPMQTLAKFGNPQPL